MSDAVVPAAEERTSTLEQGRVECSGFASPPAADGPSGIEHPPWDVGAAPS